MIWPTDLLTLNDLYIADPNQPGPTDGSEPTHKQIRSNNNSDVQANERLW